MPTFHVFVHVLDDAGQRGHVLLRQGHTQVVADEVVPGLEHWGGDEVQDAGGKAEELDKEEQSLFPNVKYDAPGEGKTHKQLYYTEQMMKWKHW